MNGLEPSLAAGSADCLGEAAVDLAVANISATVLLAIADELLRIVRRGGTLVLTGFPNDEATAVAETFGEGSLLQRDGWSCLIARAS